MDEPMTVRDNVCVVVVGVAYAGGFIASIAGIGALLMLTVGKI